MKCHIEFIYFYNLFDISEFTVHAFRINANDNNKVRHISSIDIHKEYVGWFTLDITACMKQWISNPINNQGIYLTVTRKVMLKEVDLDEIGVLFNDTEELRPFAVAFLQSDNQIILRAARGLSPTSVNTFEHLMQSYQTSSRGPDDCKRHSMFISFKALNWQDWVVAPDGYTAHYCYGECNFPLINHMNATNHAIIQSLVHIMDPYRFPKPCCAPTQFINMSLLYFLDDENVTLQKYGDLIVHSCGCH